ncbi:MAG TPA: response regulator transcription factor [Novosphingobium sp.]|nr:response regulator transcription factor [Novosphingobium sp.]
MRVLLAEDDAETAAFVAQGLRALDHEVVAVGQGADALEQGMSGAFDVLVLDRMLPELDGLTVVKQLRAVGCKTPVLLLTALGRIENRVDGLDAGADDYLVKPFAFSELAARIHALGRRQAPASTVTRLQVGEIDMDLLARQVRRGGQLIMLQPREFRLLEELMRHEGQFVTRAMLIERVWNFHFDPQTKIVETHMSRLRAKLNEGEQPDLIETVRGAGYRIRPQ